MPDMLRKPPNVLVICKIKKSNLKQNSQSLFRISKFQPQPELWQEIEKVTAALRAESDTNDSEKQFLCEMFRHISSGKLFKTVLPN